MRTRLAVLISFVLGLSADPSTAAEGAASNYFPGSYGLLLPAMAPEAGSSFTSMNLFYRAKMSRTVSGGALNLGVEINSAVTVGQLIRAWDVPSTGGSFAVGAIVPLTYADFSSTVVTGGGGSFQRSGSDFALGDIGIIPASYFWNAGNFNYNLYGVIITPTGRYDVNNDVNIGRNYWSFDTVMAMTWFNEASGTEISIIPGLMVNTENPDTNYRTGTEFHVDFLYNQFVSEELAFGLRGYASSRYPETAAAVRFWAISRAVPGGSDRRSATFPRRWRESLYSAHRSCAISAPPTGPRRIMVWST